MISKESEIYIKCLIGIKDCSNEESYISNKYFIHQMRLDKMITKDEFKELLQIHYELNSHYLENIDEYEIEDMELFKDNVDEIDDEEWEGDFYVKLPNGSVEQRVFKKMRKKYCQDFNESLLLKIENEKVKITRDNIDQFEGIVYYFEDNNIYVKNEDDYDIGEV